MITQANDNMSGQFFHGTRADLKRGDLLMPGFTSNYGQRGKSSWIYLTATLDAAIWGAELAAGESRERIYIVEPMGEIFDDPNLTDKKYPGNPTRSYRSRAPYGHGRGREMAEPCAGAACRDEGESQTAQGARRRDHRLSGSRDFTR